MANFAFGTQRISQYNPLHIQALKEAIKSGINLIDTSSDYLDGSAHRAIAIAFREFEKKTVDNIKIVSKFSFQEDGDICKKLQLTLTELEVEKIDCFMVYNLEYYLVDAITKGISRDNRLDGMNKIVYKVFLELENEIKNNTINSYGISSENFSIEHSLDEFLPYEDLIAIANLAAKDAGNKQNSFSTIEFPINIIEREGFKCASWAKNNGLRVLSTRALDAIYENKKYRLADYDESSDYYHHLNNLLEVCDNDLLKSLYNLFDELDSSKHKFGSIDDYDRFLYTQAIGHIKEQVALIDAENQETLITIVDAFLYEYRKMVANECSKKTKNTLREYFKDCNLSMQECSLNFLKHQVNIDYILVGMRKPSYVAEVLALSC
ncbi:MAG: aldo/keto reductase [Campylobacterota bacterium]|nr:aldo/keto reductase [Campylobacterota bacterium]